MNECLWVIHPEAVDIFQSEPKWSADRLADGAILRATAAGNTR